MLSLCVSVQCSFNEQPTAADLAAIGEIGWSPAPMLLLCVSVQCSFHEQPTAADPPAISEIGWTPASTACFACLSCALSTSSLATDLAAISEIG